MAEPEQRSQQFAFAYRASKDADEALGRASAWAKSLDLQLTVFVPFVRPPEGGGCCGIRGRQWEQLLREAAQDQARAAKRVLGATATGPVVVVEGTSVSEIVDNFVAGAERVLMLPEKASASPFSRRTLRQIARQGGSAVRQLPAR